MFLSADSEINTYQKSANYFSEVDQAAFSFSNLVPEIEPSADPVLQARLFSYPILNVIDLVWITNNFQSKNLVFNFQRDRFTGTANYGGNPNYIASDHPNSFKLRTQKIMRNGQLIHWRLCINSPMRILFNLTHCRKFFWKTGQREHWLCNISHHFVMPGRIFGRAVWIIWWSEFGIRSEGSGGYWSYCGRKSRVAELRNVWLQ